MEVYISVPDSTELPSTCAIGWAAKAQGFFRNCFLLLALLNLSSSPVFFFSSFKTGKQTLTRAQKIPVQVQAMPLQVSNEASRFGTN